MNLLRWLQLHTALLAVLGGAFLLLSGDRTFFPWALMGGALIAFFVTDYRGWVKLPRTLGNLAALVAVAWTIREFWRQATDREAQLLTISHMLIYLQVMLLFQAKSRRLHWQLMVLSALQVVVAAALAIGPQFGMLLSVYLTLTIGTMLLLCLHGELADETLPARSNKSAGSLHRLLDRTRLQSEPSREALIGTWFRTPWLVCSTLMFTLGSLFLAAAFFFTAPRLSEAMWQSARGRAGVTGFSGEVLLKSKANIRLSEQPVMRVSFTRFEDGRHVSLATEPYFFGQVLTTYRSDQFGARWSYESPYNGTNAPPKQIPEPARSGDVVRQETALESLNSSVVFAMTPVVLLPETPPEIQFHKRSPKLIRKLPEDQTLTSREFRFAIGTLGIRHSRQLHAVPHSNPANTLQEYELSDPEREALRSFDAAVFPGLKRAADEVIHDQGLNNGTTLARALALQNHLYASGQYLYTLEFDDTVALSPELLALDPLERFIVHRRRGHCEYFASALIMMLRSQNIPARMVVGYKGGEWNPLGQYYLVRQKHAHAWVEVLLSADEVPPEELAGKPSRAGAWFRLDPTPLARQGSETASADTVGGRLTAAFDYADYLWRDYVLGLNSSRQDTVLDPVTSRSRDLLAGRFSADAWQRLLLQPGPKPAASRQATGVNQEGASASAAWVRYVLLFVVLLLAPAVIAGLVLACRWLISATFRRRRALPAAASTGLFLELKRWLSSRGIECTEGATAQELVALAAARFRLPATGGQTETRPLAAILAEVLAGYHRVRFAGDVLSAAEKKRLSQALVLLRRAEPIPRS